MNRLRAYGRLLRKRVVAIVPGFLSHVLFFAGLSGVTFGAWQIYHPSGPIVGGLLAIWVAFLISAESGK